MSLMGTSMFREVSSAFFAYLAKMVLSCTRRGRVQRFKAEVVDKLTLAWVLKSPFFCVFHEP